MSERPAPFRGPMPVLPTPITSDQRIDEKSLRRLVQYCIACDAAAIGHFGIASEFFKVSDDDRMRMTEVVVDEVAGRVPVFIGVTAPADALSVKYAEQAYALGADLLMVAAPYVTLPEASGLIEFYRRIGDATPLPIIIQDTPATAPTLTVEVVLRLFEKVTTAQYVKAEGHDFLTKTARIIELTNGQLSVIGGFGGKHLIHMLRLGVTAFMTGTEALDLHGSVIHAYLSGDEEKAARLYFDRLLPYFVFYETYPEQLLKQMLHTRGVIECPDIIPPRSAKPMSDVEQGEFQWVLNRIGLDTPWKPRASATTAPARDHSATMPA